MSKYTDPSPSWYANPLSITFCTNATFSGMNSDTRVVAVGGVSKGRPVIVIATNAPAREWRVKAGDLVKVAAGVLGGGGGGKPDLAQGGGQDASKLGAAIAEVEHTVGRTVTN